MKTLINLLLLISFSASAQFPITEEFNPGTTWTFTNGAGIQNYGAAENLGTTNIGNTPYPHNATVTITSPVFNLTTCMSVMNVSFPLTGRIELNYDFLRFQYRIGLGAWVTVQSFTGLQNATFSYPNIPTTATQFRFLLQTDGSGNIYGPPGNPAVYYYDIARFTISCAAVLPVDILSFTGSEEAGYNRLSWSVADEADVADYKIERSVDGYEWMIVDEVSAGKYEYSINDTEYTKAINYYRLKIISNDGSQRVYTQIISIDNREEGKEIISVTNLLGQLCAKDAAGVVIIQYSDGSTVKLLNQ